MVCFQKEGPHQCVGRTSIDGWRGWSAPTSAPEVSATVAPPDGSTCWNPDVFKKNKIDVHQLRLGHRLQAVNLTTLTSHSQIKPVYTR